MALFLNNINVSPMSKYTVTLVSTLKNYLEGEGEVILPINTTQIEEDCFRETNITSITIPNTVESIGWRAFQYCYSLQSVTFEEGSKCSGFGQTTYEACRSLDKITIPASVQYIGNNCFSYCTSLKSVTFEEGSQCTSIGPNAFMGCSALESISIPSSVEEILVYTFSYCDALTDIYINKPEDSISGAPWGATNATIHWNSTGPENV